MQKNQGRKPKRDNFWDSATGTSVIPELVVKAREEEMKEFQKHKVYIKVLVNACLERTEKQPIGVKWVDVNKGGEERLEYRSRLVAKEIKEGQKRRHVCSNSAVGSIKHIGVTCNGRGSGV